MYSINNVPKDIKTFHWNYPWELDEWFLDLPESEMPQNENDLHVFGWMQYVKNLKLILKWI